MDAAATNSIIDGLRNNPSTSVDVADKDNALKQEDFFALLTQQLSYQDPTKPVENDQMISQMTNFTMADGISALNTSFDDFAASMTSNQALQASSLVGQKVLIPGDVGVKVGDGGISGTFETPLASHNTKLIIEDKAGQVIYSENIDSFPKGKHAFSWDGLDNNGNPAAEGEYKVKVVGKVGDESTTLPISTHAQVQSVSLGANGGSMVVNTTNGSVKLEEIEEVGQG